MVGKSNNDGDVGVGKGSKDGGIGVIDFDAVDPLLFEEVNNFVGRGKVVGDSAVVNPNQSGVSESGGGKEKKEERGKGDGHD